MRRFIVSCLWSVPIFFLAGTALALAAGQENAGEVGKKFGGLLCLGSMGLASICGFLGFLPGTKPTAPLGRSERSSGDDDREEIARPRRHGAAALQESPVSEYHFTIGGFCDRYLRHLGVGVLLCGFGAFMVVHKQPGKSEMVTYFGFFLIALGVALFLFVFWRLLAIWHVRLSNEGVAWSGAFGNRQCDWDDIVAVYRLEKITNKSYRERILKLEFTNGESATFDQTMGNYADLADSIQQTMADLLLPVKQGEMKEQGEADFGPVKMRPKGIEMKGKYIPWTGLSRPEIINGHLVLFGLPRRPKGEAELSLGDIPNYLVLMQMLEKRDVLA